MCFFKKKLLTNGSGHMRAEGTTTSLGVLKFFFYDNFWVQGGYFGLFYNLPILTSNKYEYT